jgi:hypothetical protein
MARHGPPKKLGKHQDSGDQGPLYIGDQPRIHPEQAGLLVRFEARDWLEGGFWVEVRSSNVAAIRYDAKLLELYVKFKGGAVYPYSGVHEVKAAMMYNCSSMGRFVHQYLKNRHPTRGPL